jgi:hypothetical protein
VFRPGSRHSLGDVRGTGAYSRRAFLVHRREFWVGRSHFPAVGGSSPPASIPEPSARAATRKTPGRRVS